MIDTEKAALCARIDDLCAEVERLKQQNAMLRELENIRISQVKYCEDLDAENSKLKDERERLFHANVEKNGEVLRLVSENAKLRELAERAWNTAEMLCQAFDGPCRSDGVTIAKPCPMGERDEECVYGQIQRELRNLGIEVNG